MSHHSNLGNRQVSLSGSNSQTKDPKSISVCWAFLERPPKLRSVSVIPRWPLGFSFGRQLGTSHIFQEMLTPTQQAQHGVWPTLHTLGHLWDCGPTSRQHCFRLVLIFCHFVKSAFPSYFYLQKEIFILTFAKEFLKMCHRISYTSTQLPKH